MYRDVFAASSGAANFDLRVGMGRLGAAGTIQIDKFDPAGTWKPITERRTLFCGTMRSPSPELDDSILLVEL